jgi:hypothetical protein
MSTCRDRPCTAAHVTARQARDASKYFSVAPDHVLSCIESVGILCYMSRLVHGLPTFYSGNFFSPQKFPKKMWESRKHQHQNGVALLLCNIFRLNVTNCSKEVMLRAHWNQPNAAAKLGHSLRTCAGSCASGMNVEFR